MGIAHRAADFGADHAVAVVFGAHNAAGYGCLPEAGPATASIEFGAGIKQQGTAADAGAAPGATALAARLADAFTGA